MERQVKNAKTNLVDRISDLPDPIIHHIFSFMDMRLVIQTSTLAVRWRNLWAISPYLNFSFTCSQPRTLSSFDKKRRKHFLKFVDRVLMCRDASTVHKFSLFSEPPLDVDHLHTWLICVLKRNVKELDLLLGFDQPFELPPRVFTSEITVLTLTCSWGRDKVQLPNAICSAAKLRSLKLKYMQLPDGNSDGELILSCPVLDSLSIVWCVDSHLKVFTVSAILLESLEFTTEPDDASSCMMNICCPNLTSFSYTCFGNSNLSSVNLPALVSAYINRCIYNWTEKCGYTNWLIIVLRGICNVHALKIEADTLMDMINYPSIHQMLPSLFTNLKAITVEDSFDDGITSICAMARILSILPSVKELVWDRTWFELDDDQGSDDGGEDLHDQSILYGLETIVIRDPRGMKNELEFMKFILERAIYLKEMTIKAEYKRYSKKFRQRVLAFPRTSNSAFVHCP